MTSDGATKIVERMEIVSVEAVEDSVSDVANFTGIQWGAGHIGHIGYPGK